MPIHGSLGLLYHLIFFQNHIRMVQLPQHWGKKKLKKPQFPQVPWLVTSIQALTTASFSDLAKSSEDNQTQFCCPSCLCTWSGWKTSGLGISTPSHPTPCLSSSSTTMEIQACTGIHVCSRWKGREWWERCSGCTAMGRGCWGESGSQLPCKASFTVSRHQLPGCHGNSPTLAEGGSIEVSREMGVMEEEGGERKGKMFLVNVRC